MATSALGVVLAHAGGNDMMWDDRAGWGWLSGTVMMLILIALVLGVVWLIARTGRRPGRHDGSRPSQILAARYARGELSTEEYEQRLAALH
jgi:putative membrane protein